MLGALGPAVGCCPAQHVSWEPAVAWLQARVEGEREWCWDRQAWGPVCVPAPAEAWALPGWGLQMELCPPAFPEPCVLDRGLGAALGGLPGPVPVAAVPGRW